MNGISRFLQDADQPMWGSCVSGPVLHSRRQHFLSCCAFCGETATCEVRSHACMSCRTPLDFDTVRCSLVYRMVMGLPCDTFCRHFLDRRIFSARHLTFIPEFCDPGLFYDSTVTSIRASHGFSSLNDAAPSTGSKWYCMHPLLSRNLELSPTSSMQVQSCWSDLP